MSSTRQAQKTQQAQTDEWRPERVHAMFRRFKRGPDKKKRFIGQQPDEVIRRVVREHPIFYLGSAVPLLLGFVVLGLAVWLEGGHALTGSIYSALDVIIGVYIIGAAAYCAYSIYKLWWVNVYIITNKRILAWRGFLNPTRRETTLDKVQQVAVEQETLFSIVLNYGQVEVYLAGGKPLSLIKVPDPKGVRDDIQGIHQSYLASRPPKAVPPPVSNPAMAATLENLGKKEALPTLPNADTKYAHRHSPAKLRRPLRRFGGPLRIECEVTYEAEEYTVMYVTRSRWVLAVQLIIPVLLLLGCLLGALVARVIFGVFAIAFVALLVVIGLIIINYVDDVFILTNRRVIDIDRKFIFLYEEHAETTYDKISEIEVISPNAILLALSVGNIVVNTQGNNPNIHMRHISHPFYIQDKIYQIKGFKEKVDKVKTENKLKEDLSLWFGTVLSTLENKITSRGVPNLQSLDLWDAVERAGEFGMRVVPIGESADYPNIGSGKIVMQIPPPGTAMDINSPEKPQIQVILSKRQ
ncbi:MAG TPA: PH domain-containing protein [Ktedonobacteraceae bacterium]|nr:PH domain-containing protein [Ktedonobacteraceae bacterium]